MPAGSVGRKLGTTARTLVRFWHIHPVLKQTAGFFIQFFWHGDRGRDFLAQPFAVTPPQPVQRQLYHAFAHRQGVPAK
jgi:hypothetical protein